MKRLLPLLCLVVSLQAGATLHTVNVSNFQFSPANLNVVVGDVIRWQWQSGFHNSAAITVPAGATAWTSPYLSASGNFYDYTVTVQGFYEYYCEVHGVGMSGTFNASPVVPVKLSAFQVNDREKKPRLTWVTETESNTDYFAVHRSYDGYHFTEIARVPASGSSQVERNYFFTDAGIKTNARYVYYELAITDKDGKVQLSPIKLYRNNPGITKIITSIAPNPVEKEGHLMITFNADGAGKLLAQLIDVSGKTVLTTELYASEGVNRGHIHLADLATGVYLVKFSMNGLTETYRVKKL